MDGNLYKEDLTHDFIMFSDHLEFEGVELRVKYMNIRRENGDILVQRIKNVTNPWKGGKFMDLTERSRVINCYMVSKICYICKSITLREGDITIMLSTVKGWLYQDLSVKPS